MIDVSPEAIMEALGGIITEAADAAGIAPDLVAEMIASMLQDLPETAEAAKGQALQTFRSKSTGEKQTMKTTNYFDLLRDCQTFDAAINRLMARGLSRGLAIQRARQHLRSPRLYNEWMAKQHGQSQTMMRPPDKVQSFSMPRGFRVIGG